MHISEKRNIHIEELKEINHPLISDFIELTQDIVQGGASVGFMQGISKEEAREFWNNVFTKVEQGKIVLLVAKEVLSGKIIATVQLQIDLPQNQPHRADVAKMLVHSSFRRLGIAENLLQHLELIARKIKKSLLVLDTVTNSPAHALYLKCGWNVVGNIPNYALFPDGSPCSTTYFYKHLE
ncbi:MULTISPECIES: GNAT family N-acetyltransferase [unclassified Sphingobacterium]|uniref:GNAT family N-acetyltransferase n=1 Tax=unclassified Sphingobacterium TaxID=2609468 RepID=UPI0025E2F404|nr:MULTISPECIES: GNAT family N-acetyltransferase [unclassified Sphingobacterium]